MAKKNHCQRKVSTKFHFSDTERILIESGTVFPMQIMRWSKTRKQDRKDTTGKISKVHGNNISKKSDTNHRKHQHDNHQQENDIRHICGQKKQQHSVKWFSVVIWKQNSDLKLRATSPTSDFLMTTRKTALPVSYSKISLTLGWSSIPNESET